MAMVLDQGNVMLDRMDVQLELAGMLTAEQRGKLVHRPYCPRSSSARL